MSILIREYSSANLHHLLYLFHETAHNINIRDYTQEQVNAWAPDHINRDLWDKTLSDHITLVAVKNDLIVGFGDIDNSGYLDHLYVHHNYQGQGIATALCDKLESAVTVNSITVHASITAVPFFTKRSYRIIKSQRVTRNRIP